MKMFQFVTFYAKLLWVQNHCVLGSIKSMNSLKFMMELDLVLFGPERHDAIDNRTRYLISRYDYCCNVSKTNKRETINVMQMPI